MSAEEVVDWLVPFTGELEPVAAVPPICVELTIREACNSISECYASS
jgi:hypothetical protein